VTGGQVRSSSPVASAGDFAAGFSSELPPPNRLLKRSLIDCACTGAAKLRPAASKAAAQTARPITGLSPMDVPCINVSPGGL
jgi:hypothetical protein